MRAWRGGERRFKPHFATFCISYRIAAHRRGGFVPRERAAPDAALPPPPRGQGAGGIAAETQVRLSPTDGAVRGSARGKLWDLIPLLLFLLALPLGGENLILSTCFFLGGKKTHPKPKTFSAVLSSICFSRS